VYNYKLYKFDIQSRTRLLLASIFLFTFQIKDDIEEASEAYYTYVEEAYNDANEDSALSWKANQMPSHLTKL